MTPALVDVVWAHDRRDAIVDHIKNQHRQMGHFDAEERCPEGCGVRQRRNAVQAPDAGEEGVKGTGHCWHPWLEWMPDRA